MVVELSLHPTPPPPAMWLERPFSGEFKAKIERTSFARKILGLAIDLGISPWSRTYSGMLGTSKTDLEVAVLPYPRWVSDETWENRHDLAKKYVRRVRPDTHDNPNLDALAKRESDGIGDFFGYIRNLFLQKESVYGGKMWIGRWFSGQWKRTAELWSMQDALDAILHDELVMPLSKREAWEAQNVERGEFLLPEPEEVELYRMLGEPLPFFWGTPRLAEWLSERDVGSSAEHGKLETGNGEPS